jgi:hypothetical protein
MLTPEAGYIPMLGPSTPRRWLTRIRGLDPNTLDGVSSYKGRPSPGSIFWAEAWKGPQTVIFGHTVFDDVVTFDHAIGIDTGACFGNKLTCLVIEPDGRLQVLSVDSKKTYMDKGRNDASAAR